MTKHLFAAVSAFVSLVCLPAFAGPAGDGLRGDVLKGGVVFLARCALCHGTEGDGNGQMAKLLDPRPANLQRSVLSEAQRDDIVRHGSAAVGRSAAMPRWELELDEEQLRNVIAYVADVAARGPHDKAAP
jgi:mono/diheme cytochrome c family protein